MIRNATISSCGKFRYLLTRKWDSLKPCLGFIMLNPSTADGVDDDPTIRKCLGFAQRLGFGSIIVTNLYAYRATSPQVLKAEGYQVGEENDWYINVLMANGADQTICAWGANARGHQRAADVIARLRNPKALRLLDDGTPAHPLMLPYTCQLQDIK